MKTNENIFHSSQKTFFENDFKTLDRKLSPEQQQEWNSIYASFQSKSILSGTVIGIESVTTPEQGAIPCLTIVDFRVKILIPEPFIWLSDEPPARYTLNSMVGTKVEYVITAVDRDGDCAVASRAAALEQQRWHAINVLHIKTGDIVTCNILAVGASHLTATVHGFDVVLTQAQLSYSFLGDLRESYRSGQEMRAQVQDVQPDALTVSVRDVNPNPYIGAEQRHPVGSTRMATITGKHAGGVFCQLPDGCTVVCRYAQQFSDDQFQIGDQVVVQIQQLRDDRMWLRGKIRAKLG